MQPFLAKQYGNTKPRLLYRISLDLVVDLGSGIEVVNAPDPFGANRLSYLVPQNLSVISHHRSAVAQLDKTRTYIHVHLPDLFPQGHAAQEVADSVLNRYGPILVTAVGLLHLRLPRFELILQTYGSPSPTAALALREGLAVIGYSRMR